MRAWGGRRSAGAGPHTQLGGECRLAGPGGAGKVRGRGAGGVREPRAASCRAAAVARGASPARPALRFVVFVRVCLTFRASLFDLAPGYGAAPPSTPLLPRGYLLSLRSEVLMGIRGAECEQNRALIRIARMQAWVNSRLRLTSVPAENETGGYLMHRIAQHPHEQQNFYKASIRVVTARGYPLRSAAMDKGEPFKEEPLKGLFLCLVSSFGEGDALFPSSSASSVSLSEESQTFSTWLFSPDIFATLRRESILSTLRIFEQSK